MIACGEDATIVLDTVAAAAYQDYPVGQHRVFVLDDGQDDLLQSMVGALNEKLLQDRNQQVVYWSRSAKPEIYLFVFKNLIQYPALSFLPRSSTPSLPVVVQINGHVYGLYLLWRMSPIPAALRLLCGASTVFVSVSGNDDAVGAKPPHGMPTLGIHDVSSNSSGA